MKLSKVTLVKKEFYTFYVESEGGVDPVECFNEMEYADLDLIIDEIGPPGGKVDFLPSEHIIEVENFKEEPEGTGLKTGVFHVALKADGGYDFSPPCEDDDDDIDAEPEGGYVDGWFCGCGAGPFYDVDNECSVCGRKWKDQ